MRTDGRNHARRHGRGTCGRNVPARRALTTATALAIGAAGAPGTAQSLKRLVQRPALDDRRVLADQLGQIFGRRRDCHRLDSDAGALHHLASAAGLVRQDERHHVTLFAGARSAAGTMQERFGVGRRIGLHDQRHIMDVDAASGHVGGNQYAYQALLERQQVAVTLLLAEVACRSTAGMPSSISFFAIFLAWNLVRVNRMRLPVPLASRRITSCLLPCDTSNT